MTFKEDKPNLPFLSANGRFLALFIVTVSLCAALRYVNDNSNNNEFSGGVFASFSFENVSLKACFLSSCSGCKNTNEDKI